MSESTKCADFQSSDLVKRLRCSGIGQDNYHSKYPEQAFGHLNNSGLLYEAADRIEKLEAENARRREALLYASAVVDSVKDCEEVDPNTLAAAIIKMDALQEGEG